MMGGGLKARKGWLRQRPTKGDVLVFCIYKLLERAFTGRHNKRRMTAHRVKRKRWRRRRAFGGPHHRVRFIRENRRGSSWDRSPRIFQPQFARHGLKLPHPRQLSIPRTDPFMDGWKWLTSACYWLPFCFYFIGEAEAGDRSAYLPGCEPTTLPSFETSTITKNPGLDGKSHIQTL